jgi:acetyl-CoA carboxylase biotin carboxyl carrier protein
MGLSHEDVREILRIIDESDLDELSIETDGFSLHVSKSSPARSTPTVDDARGGPGSEGARGSKAPVESESPRAPAKRAQKSAEEDGLVDIPSPMLGTFYRAESPGAPPFVEVGAEVEPGTTVCIIEVMKMMNSIPAGVAGTVEEICPENGQLVEYGEPLFRVRAQ